MIVLIDSNIVLDSMLKNEGFYQDTEDLLVLSGMGVFQGFADSSIKVIDPKALLAILNPSENI